MIQVLKLLNGESIICDMFSEEELRESFGEEAEKIIGASSVLITQPQQIVYSVGESPNNVRCHLVPWLPYTGDRYVVVKESLIVTSVSPTENVINAYLNLFEKPEPEQSEPVSNVESLSKIGLTEEAARKILDDLLPEDKENLN